MFFANSARGETTCLNLFNFIRRLMAYCFFVVVLFAITNIAGGLSFVPLAPLWNIFWISIAGLSFFCLCRFYILTSLLMIFQLFAVVVVAAAASAIIIVIIYCGFFAVWLLTLFCFIFDRVNRVTWVSKKLAGCDVNMNFNASEELERDVDYSTGLI